jgi:hypothetical protein
MWARQQWRAFFIWRACYATPSPQSHDEDKPNCSFVITSIFSQAPWNFFRFARIFRTRGRQIVGRA